MREGGTLSAGNELFRRYLDGDMKAFDEIVKAYRENLIFFVMRYVRSSSLAEEIAQDAFVELLLHKHRYNFSCSLKTYLFTIAKNKAINHLRRQKFLSDEEIDINTKSDEDELAQKLIKDEQSAMLYKVLERLNGDYRCALHLVYIENLSYDDAGKVMGKNRKQIENLVFRAKAAARNEFEKGGIML
ncbi:MAG: sigma-70 family RNA polymerase sigma factor [Ruminococcaceae bacterium]|nr:sigma-70 family RNA polymerase sigma factor [Oscillospiraceae bacterium]